MAKERTFRIQWNFMTGHPPKRFRRGVYKTADNQVIGILRASKGVTEITDEAPAEEPGRAGGKPVMSPPEPPAPSETDEGSEGGAPFDLYSDLTKAQLIDLLKGRGVKVDATAKKADLLKRARETQS